MKTRTTLQSEIDIVFDNPKKAKEYFIDGEWKESFFKFDELKEVAEHLAYAFYVTPEQYNFDKKRYEKFIEGFGNCSSCVDEESHSYTYTFLDDAIDYGTIKISIASELTPTDVDITDQDK